MFKLNKRKLAMCMVIVMVMQLITVMQPQSVSAASIPTPEASFTVSSAGAGSCTITGYKGASKDVVIPSTIGGKAVTAIGDRAFYNKALTSVSIPYGINVIGENAFAGNNLKTLLIPGSVATIKPMAFRYNGLLEAVIMLYGVETIGDGAFAGCKKLSSVTMADSLETISGNMLNSVGKNVTIVANEGTPASDYKPAGTSTDLEFMGSDSPCNFIYSADSKGDIVIKGYTGRGDNLDVVLPDASAFGGEEIVELAEGAFENIKNVNSFDLSNSMIKTIGANAFAGCELLKEIKLPDTVTAVGANAFDCNDGSVSWQLSIVSDSDAVRHYILDNGLKVTFTPYNPGLSIYHRLHIATSGGGYITKGTGGIYKKGFTLQITAQPSQGYYFKGWTSSAGGMFVIPEGEDQSDTTRATAFTMPDNDVTLTAVFAAQPRPKWVIENGVVLEFNQYGEMNIPATWGATGEEDPNKIPTTEISGGVFNYGNPTKVIIPASIERIAVGVFNWYYNITAFNVDEANSNYSSDEYGVLFNEGKTELIRYPRYRKEASYTIPDSVVTIAQGAFSYSPYLESVTIPSGVTMIPASAFYECNRLKNVTMQGDVTEIGNSAFYGCSSLNTIAPPLSLTKIGSQAFYRCGFTKVLITPNISTIGDGAFAYCSVLKEIEVAPENEHFKSVDGVLFNIQGTELLLYPCQKDTVDYTVPKDVVTINGMAFYGSNNLNTVICNDELVTIGNSVFESCGKLTSISFNAGLKTIGSGAFESCRSLSSVTFNEGLETIGSGAFQSCNGLTAISIPASVSSIGSYAFRFSNNIASYLVSEGNEAYSSDAAGVLFNKGQTVLIAYPPASAATTYAVPASVETVVSYAFVNSNKLRAVRLQEGVTNVGYYAFEGCSALKALEIRNPNADLPSYMTGGIASANLVLRGYFHRNAADGTPDKNTVSTVQSYAQSSGYRFQQLDQVTGALTVDNAGTVTKYAGTEAEVVLPNAVVINQTSMTTTGNADEFEYGDDLSRMADEAPYVKVLKKIGRGSFAKAPITDVKVNRYMAEIEDYAFEECNELEEFTITRSINKIKPEAFIKCAKFKKFNVAGDNSRYSMVYDGILSNRDKTIIEIVPTAYSGVGGTLTIAAPMMGIADGAFFLCTGLNKVIINGLKQIGVSAFYKAFTGENTAVSVELNDVLEINDRAFADCTGLKTVTINAVTERIGSGVFAGCTGLESINAAAESPYFESIDGVLFTKSTSVYGRQVVTYPAGKAAAPYVIPEGTVGVVGSAFANAKATEITVPNSVVNIAARGFANCENLVELKLYNNLMEIGPFAFADCPLLEKVIIPSTVTSVGESALSGCLALDKVEIYNQHLQLKSSTFLRAKTGFTIYSVSNYPVHSFALDHNYNFAELTAEQLADMNFAGTPAPIRPTERFIVKSYASWTELADLLGLVEEGGTILVDMMSVVDETGEYPTQVPAIIPNSMKNKDIEVVFFLNGYQWILNGLDISEDMTEDLDLSLHFVPGSGTINPDDLVNNGIDAADVDGYLELDYRGQFPFTMVLELNMKNQPGIQAGRKIVLYFYNPETANFQFAGTGTVTPNKTIRLKFLQEPSPASLNIIMDETSGEYMITPGENEQIPEVPAVPEVTPTPETPAVPEATPTPETPAVPEATPVPEIPAVPEAPIVPAATTAPELPSIPDTASVPAPSSEPAA